PFSMAVVNLNANDEKITGVSEKIYGDLTAMGIDVIYDDRKLSAGIKLKDIDLIGIPFKIVVGNRTIKDNKYELNIKESGITETFGDLESLYKRVGELLKNPRV
ncbi:MAG: His/Gly/Thr/Pro-type tRNA ligase C-terminal domain-containing protein, partial [Deltaproteobacteria bacterium]|nr:His/Gly/Thr/Pro-type tRNA ligase C-terminal domain-containing protein [Deltaproteobacteria bacterium]